MKNMFSVLCLVLLAGFVYGHQDHKAVVKLQGDGVDGYVVFTIDGDLVRGEGEVTGLKPGKHGFHIHASGDLRKGCASTLGHFNPFNKNHGAPTDDERHVGDLGNIIADANGVAAVKFEDKLISLHGDLSIIGRAVVVHEGEDDLGRGNSKDSLTTGNAGGRVACGIIGILPIDMFDSSDRMGYNLWLLLFAAFLALKWQDIISGIGLIVAGAVVLVDIGDYTHFMEGRIIAPPIVLIVAGVIVFIVAFLGCYGAIKENYYMLIAFAVLLLIIFIIELAVGIAAAVYKSNFQMIMKDQLKMSMGQYSDNRADRMAWDNLQTKMECCGVDGPEDWPEKKRPFTCCHTVRDNANPPEDFHCKSAVPGDEILYTDGCYQKLEEKCEMNAKILIGVGIGIAFVELIGILLACWLAAAIKRKE